MGSLWVLKHLFLFDFFSWRKVELMKFHSYYVQTYNHVNVFTIVDNKNLKYIYITLSTFSQAPQCSFFFSSSLQVTEGPHGRPGNVKIRNRPLRKIRS